MLVVPTVSELLVRLPLPILERVLLDPLIVLLVSVWLPVKVATVESIAIVTAVEPLYDVPDSPVPMVSAFVAVAATVTDPPRLTDEPLIVTALLVRLPFPMLVSVLVLPLMVLLVRFCVPDSVATIVESILIVPAEVIGPPVKPVPVSTVVTVPAPATAPQTNPEPLHLRNVSAVTGASINAVVSALLWYKTLLARPPFRLYVLVEVTAFQ
jgi:hypothetical protein